MVWPNRVRGLLTLALIALLGYGLALLRDAGRPEWEAVGLEGTNGETIVLALSEGRAAHAWPFGPKVRVIVSRVPVGYDAEKSLLRFPGGKEEVLPPDWTAVLVEEGRSPRPLEVELAQSDAQAVLTQAMRAGTGPRAYQAARQALLGVRPELRALLGN